MANYHTRILMVEDNPLDAELIERELRRASMNFSAKRVDNEADFRAELESSDPDVILADYALPTFDGVSALRVARSLVPDTPFIFVSGSIGEERAIQALREGAADYMIKDRLTRLPSAILRARDERRERRLRRRTEEALHRSEERFKYAAQATQEVITDHDLASDTLWISDAVRAAWGHTLPEEVVPASWWDEHIHPDDRNAVRDSLSRAMAEQRRWTGRYRFARADGTYADVFDRAIIIRDRDNQAVRVISAVLDISDRSVAEATIQRLSHENALILESAAEGIIAADVSGHPIIMNRAATAMTGFTLEELQAAPSIHAVIHHSTGAGAPRPQETCPASQVLRDGKPRSSEEVFWNKSGQSFLVSANWSPMVENQRIVGTALFFRDITEQRRLERQLAQSQRVSSLGRVAATIAHEFNNVLMGIQPFAEVIRNRAHQDEKILKSATQILTSVARGKRVTQDILRFTQPAEPSLNTIELTEWVRHLVPELRALIGNRIELRVETPPRRVLAHCDAAQLQQVVANLVINARDAISGAGSITLSVVEPRDGMAGLDVSDTGTGMPPSVLENIFEPLFTTKRSGTGLGLAVAQQVITRHGGSIQVRSIPGEGTTFSLLLPTAEEAVPPESAKPAANAVVRRVLVVDDDPAVAEGIVAMLEAAGIDARAVHEGSAAAAAIDELSPDAVILDIGLADMNGLDLLDQLVASHPQLPVVMSTGHMEESALQDHQHGRVAYLRKPYDSATLLETLASITQPGAPVKAAE